MGLLYYGLSGNLKRLSEQLLEDELNVCRALVRERGGDMHALREEAEIDSAIRKYEKFYVRVIGERGQVLATTPGMDQELSSAHIAQEEARSRGGIFWLQSPDGTPYRAMVATLAVDRRRCCQMDRAGCSRPDTGTASTCPASGLGLHGARGRSAVVPVGRLCDRAAGNAAAARHG